MIAELYISNYKNYYISNYRFAFNGQEKTDEISGVSNHLDFKYRGYDPLTGRFWSVDPLSPKYPMLSPFQFAANTPIWARELEGLEGWFTSSGSTTPESEFLAPVKEGAGPLSKSNAKEQGFVEFGVIETKIEKSFSNKDIEDFTDWNSRAVEPGRCFGAAITGSEILTGVDAGFKDENGELTESSMNNKNVFDLGKNLAKKGVATEIPTITNKETTTVINVSNDPSIQNSVFLVGPCKAYHSLIMSYNTSNNTFSIFDQGSHWDKKNATQGKAQEQISEINAVHPSWKTTRMWQLYKKIEIVVKHKIE